MELLETLVVDHLDSDLRKITLSSGALIATPSELFTEYLLISCKPGLYEPEAGGSIAELAAIGISVNDLEKDCGMDFRPLLPCWISKSQRGLFFKYLVVYEPTPGPYEAERSAWKAFQALQVFAGHDTPSTLAMTILNMREEGADSVVMLRMMVLAAASLAARANWSNISIVVPSEVAEVAAQEFRTLKARYLEPPIESEAIRKVLKHINRAHPQFSTHRLKAQEPLEETGLTGRQYKIVQQYTLGLYASINRVLREHDVADPEYAHWHSTIEALATGLAQMKKHRVSDVHVYRDLRYFSGIEELYNVGSITRERSYTSSSRTLHPVRGGYMLLIRSAIGKDISTVSMYPTEEEVLFDSDMHHLVYLIEEADPVHERIDIWSDEILPNTSATQFCHL